MLIKLDTNNLRKQIILILLLSIPIFTMSGCAAIKDLTIKWTPSTFTDETLNANDNISVRTEHPVYKPGIEVINLEISNNTSEEFTFGAEYTIEKKRKNSWYYNRTLQENTSWIAIGYILPANSSISDKLNVKTYFGHLSVGEYRILKNIAGTTYSAEFSVAKDGYSD